jgi:hypothetical protein
MGFPGPLVAVAMKEATVLFVAKLRILVSMMFWNRL